MVKINVELAAELKSGRAFHPIAGDRRAGFAERAVRMIAHREMEVFLHRIFYLVVKDETKNPVKKDLHLAVSDNAEGPFSKAGPAITGDWVEGPTALQIGGEFYIYFDHYGNPKYYGAVKSPDLEHWQDISPQVSFPKGIRHGTALKVPASVVQPLQLSPTAQTKP